MGLNKNVLDDNERIERVCSKIRGGKKDDPTYGLVEKLERIKNGDEVSVIMPLSLVADFCETILRNSSFNLSNYFSIYKQAEDIYKFLFAQGEYSPSFAADRGVFLSLFDEGGPVSRGFFDNRLFCSFANKANYLNYVKLIVSYPHAAEIFAVIKEYGLSIREYMLGDESYLANLLKVSTKLSSVPSGSFSEVIKEETENIRRMNGIYDIDPVKMLRVEESVNRAADIVNRSYDLLKELDCKKNKLEEIVTYLEKRAGEIEATTSYSLELKADNAKELIEKSFSEIEASERRATLMEKDLLLQEVFADAEGKLNEYRNIANAIANSTAVDIASLNRDADKIYQKVSNLISNDENVKAILKRSVEDEELVEKINKLSMLNSANIETFGKAAEKNVAHSLEDGKNSASEQHVELTDEEPILPVNPLLDSNVPFEKRFSCIMKEKERREALGELFHDKFNDVLIAVMEDANPYLIGPSGCGKTYMVRQIASLLNMDYTDIGYINEEYDILGFVNAAGRYTESNFYRCYKYGHLAFCDELDNGNSRATVKLNSFLSNGPDSNFSFPGGERVKRHPNFRIISAGNTVGNGADINYNSREKIEESVQQRLLPIFIDYDNRVEQAILKDYPDWFDFVCLFRQATDKWTASGRGEASGILTTRDTSRVKRYLDNGSFTPQKIIDYEFIQTKSPEYLTYLDKCMSSVLGEYPNATKLYDIFHNGVQNIIGKGRQ